MEKRERSLNYTQSDRQLLISIVTKYSAIIENKKFDSITLKQKKLAWDKVAEDFNCATNNLKRSGIQLRNAYKNLKRKLKIDKLELYKSDGGVIPTQTMIDPLKNRLDGSENYILEDNRTELETTVTSDVDEISDENSPQTEPPSLKKTKITDIYDSINIYTQKKIQRKLELELEILEIKKKKEEELLKQEKFRTMGAELDYLMKKKAFENFKH
ncbi:hypothetical protein FQR65_LT04724 [Abscondita terminalis]|nr:hypothetical protein FQR65_LT04724 [Abscondita terminalis]